MKAGFSAKLWGLALALGLLWVGLNMVRGVVQEREARRNEAQHSLANSLAQDQTLLGPVMVRSCTESWAEKVTRKDQDDASERTTLRWQKKAHTLRQAAHSVVLNGQLQGEARHRGLYRLNAYVAQATVQAQWAALEGLAPPAASESAQSSVNCQAPRLAFAVSDARGLRAVHLRVNGQALGVLPGSTLDATPQGFHAPLAEALWRAAASEAEPGSPSAPALKVELQIEWVGTASLSVAPVADQIEATWRSNWAHPSFGGHFLPHERQVSEQGFTAKWKLSALSSTAASSWARGQGLCKLSALAPEATAAGELDHSAGPAQGCVEAFSVTLLDPVNPYVLADRASKYGLLFVVLTFVGVGLLEVLKRLRVHPIQYLLVGAALALFFLLLISLAEHLAFAWAYAIASAACTLLLAVYGRFMLKGWRAGSAFGAALAALYAALYVVLHSEQTALLLGSLLLFAALAVVMLSTRNLDWYVLQHTAGTGPGPGVPSSPNTNPPPGFASSPGLAQAPTPPNGPPKS